MRREFHFREGTSNKFWAIDLDGAQFTVNFGKIGTAGQSQTKSFGSEAEALKQSEKLIAEKTGKGYAEVGSATAASPTPQASTAQAPAQAVSTAQAPAAQAPTVQAPAVQAPAVQAKAVPAKASKAATVAESPPEPPLAPPPVSAPSSPPPVAEIALDPVDWFYNTSPRPPALVRPAAPPFDLASCLHRLRTGIEKAALSPGMSAEEASFWMSALEGISRKEHQDEVADQLATRPLKVWTAQSLRETILANHGVILHSHAAPMVIILDRLLEPEVFLEVIVDLSGHGVWPAIRLYALPYWSDAEVERMRAWLAPRLSQHLWPTDYYQIAPMAWHMAAMLGMHKPLRDLVASWPDKYYGDPSWDHSHYNNPQPIVLGLGDPGLSLVEFQRLRLSLNKPQYIRGWLAVCGLFGMEFPRDCILAVKGRTDAEPLVEALGLARAPETAPAMLELKISSKAPKPASQWLEQNIALAVPGLLETANGRGKLADAAIDFLRKARKKGVEPVLTRPLERVQRDVIDWVEVSYPPLDDATTPEWLKGEAPAGKLPAWLDLENLPPLVVSGRCLNPAQVKAVLLTLPKATFESPPELLVQLRRHADEASRTAFAWALLESWLAEGGVAKERWTLAASGFLGGDEIALRLTPMIRKWPGESQHQRAVFGLECLRAISTDTALMCLNGMAQKLEFKALKAKAVECIEGIAAQRNMTRAQLEDRIVPDCGLDERGTRVFDFGPRQFRFVLGQGMKPMVKDGEGKVKADLPAPGARDDAELSSASVQGWKLLKKQLKDLVKVQAERLEQAMVTGRRWTEPEFRTLLVQHPLMINLVRLLLWGCYDDRGHLSSTFRIDEEGRPADSNDDPLTLPESASIAVVHPLHLSSDLAAAWGTVFADYEILSPFPQLGRPVYQLAAGEGAGKYLTRYAERKVAAPTLVGTLEKLGWVRGIPEDGGVFHEHSKPFYGANVTAVVQYEGVPVGSYMADWDDQSVERCFFVPGIFSPESYPNHDQALTLDQVDPVAMSEVLADLERLVEKSR